MKSFLFSAVAVAVFWIPWVPAAAQQAGIYEPFTHQANAASWLVYDYADGEFYTPGWDSAGDGFNPDIFYTFTGTSTFEFLAGEFSSDGAFVGNLAAGGVDAIGCDVYVEDIDSFSFGEFYLISSDGSYYYSDFIDPETSGWDYAYASLTEEDWYVYENDDFVAVPLTPEILSGITEVGVRFYPLAESAANDTTVAIDNFTYYGALVLPELTTSAAGGLFQLGFDRRPGIGYSIQSSPNLLNWTLVPGEEFITGTAPYTMSKPLGPGSRFFKVGIEDFLTPVPDVGP